MEIIFLGERFFVPHYSRNIASVAVRFDNYKEACLFDCGEGTQNYLLQSGLKNKQIKRIILSELNSDTCLGVIGLLATFSLNERLVPLEIYAPERFCKYLRLFSRYSQTNFSYAVKIKYVKTGVICKFYDYKIIALALTSHSNTFGYSIVEKEKPGKFRIKEAQFLKIPSGPIYGDLKNHNKFILTNGLLINGKQLCELPKRGRKFTYLSKYEYNRNIVELAWRADLLLLNFSFQKYLQNQFVYFLIDKRILQASKIRYLVKLHVTLGCNQNSLLIYCPPNKVIEKRLNLNSPVGLKITSKYSLKRQVFNR